MKTLLILAALMVAVPAIAGPPKLRDCARGVGQLENIALSWRPTNTIEPPAVVTIPPGAPVAAGAMMSTTVRVEVKALADSRQDPRRIGENLESTAKGCVFPVTTSADGAAWTTDRIRFVLGQLGVTIVEKGGDVVLSGELRKFFVIEDNTYRGVVGLRLDVTKAGTIVWSGLVTGSNSRFGSSYKLENYQESLSDAIIDAMGHLVENASFVRAVSP